jgi:hypothetical protein
MAAEEDRHELAVGDLRGIVLDADDFRVAGVAGAYLLVGGIRYMSACIAGLDLRDALSAS